MTSRKLADESGAENTTIWLRLRRFSFENWLFHILSDHTVGGDSVPLSWSSKKFSEGGVIYVLSFLNDSFEVGIGYPTEWHITLKRKTFHKMILWYLWKWSFSEWFGFRRWVWYKLLIRRVNFDELHDR